MKSRLLILALVLALFAWLFAGALSGGNFVFRDGGDYYPPLFRLVQQQWSSGRPPLWNPYHNLGMPLAANATAGAFYPGKLVFALPLSFDAAYRAYILAHVLLAAAAAYVLARHWKASVEAAGLAALSYAFCGNVLFQYCNVIFLVGAAWLPLAVLATYRMLTQGSLRWTCGFAALLALIVLGGDPQTAYHVALFAIVYALRQAWLARRCATSTDKHPWHRPIAIVVMGLGLAAALAAVQVLPSWEFARASDRSAGGRVQSLYDIPAALAHPDAALRIADGLLCRIEPGTHQEHVYEFSVGPWRWIEYVWPNLGGRQFPTHRRWFDFLPAEGRIWVPSLYMGLLPLILALVRFRLRRGEALERGLSWVVLLSLLAALGTFGLGWIVQQASGGAAGESLGQPWGGLYWLMTWLLPGYAQFRYPAKLLVVAELGLSMLATRGWDQMSAGREAGVRRWLLWLGVLSAAGALVALVVRPWWPTGFAAASPNVLFGPLDVMGAANDLLASFLHAAVLCAALAVLLRPVARGRVWAGAVMLVLTAVDLAVANGWMVVCAPPSATDPPSKLVVALDSDQSLWARRRACRVFRSWTWLPEKWQEVASPQRLNQLARWNRDTLAPNHHLDQQIALAQVPDTMMPYDYQLFLAGASSPAANGDEELPITEAELDVRQGRGVVDLLGLQYLVMPKGARLPDVTPVDLAGVGLDSDRDDIQVWRNPRCFPRAWVVHDVKQLPELKQNDARAVAGRTREVLYENGRLRDFSRQAVVESDTSIRPPDAVASEPGSEACRIIGDEPLCVQIEAQLARPGLVVLADQFFPGWELTVETAGQGRAGTPILRTNRVMRGCWLPAGQHRLTYTYRPVSFFCGALVSATAWVCLAIGLLAWLYCRATARRKDGCACAAEVLQARLSGHA